jgi:probable HAF family extracellular repeat protein
MVDLGTPFGTHSEARGLSDAGLVVGKGGANWAATWSGGWNVLGVLPPGGMGWESQAVAVNASGQVAGWSDVAGGRHAFLWDNGVMADLGTLGSSQSVACGINDDRAVAGYSDTTDGCSRAFLWEGGAMVDLGTLGGRNSRAYDINNAGSIVGVAATANDQMRPFIVCNDTMYNLRELTEGFGWLWHAYAISDTGHVVGDGMDAYGNYRAILLTPVPEPSAISLLGLGVAVAWGRRMAYLR